MDPNNDVVREFPHLFRVYKDGRIERLLGNDTTPPGTDPVTSVDSKDVTVNPQTGVSLRLYLPPNPAGKLPLLIYIHGGAFCVCSPSNPSYHGHINTVAARANAVVASVHYRLAPEHPLPIAYDDSWEAVKWIGAHAAGTGPEPWLNQHADFNNMFLAGDSAGANLAHNMAMRGTEEGFGGLKLQGMVLIHPYFGNESKDQLVEYLYPGYAGPDDPKIHATYDPKLSGLGCPKVLVFISEKDFLRQRGQCYYEALKKSGWKGVVDIVEFPAEDHVFHLFDPTKEKAEDLVKRFVSFIKQT
ncbi:hypothetical protein RJT34_04575 [Clitoria ternatea]|uniref:Alpha/beta hydrolase fold-3 domain-containing protein n=1 Tax=Clitoria ternatea TaxID=43366 RepID=A0AAN9Q2S6_CLITE